MRRTHATFVTSVAALTALTVGLGSAASANTVAGFQAVQAAAAAEQDQAALLEVSLLAAEAAVAAIGQDWAAASAHASAARAAAQAAGTQAGTASTLAAGAEQTAAAATLYNTAMIEVSAASSAVSAASGVEAVAAAENWLATAKQNAAKVKTTVQTTATAAVNQVTATSSPAVAAALGSNTVTAVSEVGPLRLQTQGVYGSQPAPSGAKAAAEVNAPLVGVAALQSSSVSTFDVESGFQSLITIDGPQAPTRFEFPLELPAGATLQLEPEDGSATVVDAEGLSLGNFAAPWATDANGNAVATSFEVSGNTLVQVIPHGTGSAYPITADPSTVWGWTVCVATVATVLAGNATLALKVLTVVKRFGTLKKTLQIAYKAYKQAAAGKKVEAIKNAIGAVGAELFGINSIKSKCFN